MLPWLLHHHSMQEGFSFLPRWPADLSQQYFRATIRTVRQGNHPIDLNSYRDQGILQLVADAQYVTHSQLFRLAHQEYREFDGAVFNWRIRRMVANGWVRRHNLPSLHDQPFYSIRSAGLRTLEQLGTHYLGTSFGCEKNVCPFRLWHALEINEVRLVLLESGRLDRWLPEPLIRILSLWPPRAYGKVYDGIARILLDTGSVEVAIEYETTVEGGTDYESLRQAVNSEKRLQVFLFLAVNLDVLFDLLHAFWGTKRLVFFALIQDLKDRVFAAPVQSANDRSSVSLGQALERASSISGGATDKQWLVTI